jgi:hypothetical protein
LATVSSFELCANTSTPNTQSTFRSNSSS